MPRCAFLCDVCNCIQMGEQKNFEISKLQLNHIALNTSQSVTGLPVLPAVSSAINT